MRIPENYPGFIHVSWQKIKDSCRRVIDSVISHRTDAQAKKQLGSQAKEGRAPLTPLTATPVDTPDPRFQKAASSLKSFSLFDETPSAYEIVEKVKTELEQIKSLLAQPIQGGEKGAFAFRLGSIIEMETLLTDAESQMMHERVNTPSSPEGNKKVATVNRTMATLKVIIAMEKDLWRCQVCNEEQTEALKTRDAIRGQPDRQAEYDRLTGEVESCRKEIAETVAKYPLVCRMQDTALQDVYDRRRDRLEGTILRSHVYANTLVEIVESDRELLQQVRAMRHFYDVAKNTKGFSSEEKRFFEKFISYSDRLEEAFIEYLKEADKRPSAEILMALYADPHPAFSRFFQLLDEGSRLNESFNRLSSKSRPFPVKVRELIGLGSESRPFPVKVRDLIGRVEHGGSIYNPQRHTPIIFLQRQAKYSHLFKAVNRDDKLSLSTREGAGRALDHIEKLMLSYQNRDQTNKRG